MEDNLHILSEEDIKLRYITPAIMQKGWSVDDITMETKVKITDGKMNLRGNLVARGKAKFADYVLYYNKANPIAIVEAKDANHSVSFGMQQAKDYAQMMDVPFAFSSNGLGFEEYDFLTGKERSLSMDEFPTKDELYARYLKESNDGEGLSEDELKVINQPFCTGQDIYPPRYYQRNAVNRTVDAVARGEKRMLLVMATGTGKTYTAFQIVYRLLKAGLIKKVLYLADRNVLVDQSIEQDFKPLANNIHKVNYQKDKGTKPTAHQIYFSLYQQLIGENGKQNYKELFKAEFFDMVIVDECHRGSAKDDSSWREILEYFNDAIQLGMTATPKETKYQSNITYFSEPLYTYSLKEGIDDGFLAPFKVINIKTNIGDGYNIIVEDRIREVAHEITNYLKQTGRMQKTIVFCADEDHAERMRIALVNENSDMCKKNPDYVVRITGSDDYGKGKLDYFISVSSPYPVIATTSKLLSTGVDCKMVKLIVLDQNINSMTEFKQIVGRGTRLREKEGKKYFIIMDMRNVTRLFADPAWDGPIEVDDGYTPQPKPGGYVIPDDSDNDGNDTGEEDPVYNPKPIVDKEGCRVEIISKVVSVYDADGKLLRTENITDYTRKNINDTYANLSDFILHWKAAERKAEISDLLRERGIDLQALKEEQGMADVDDFDFICHIAYNQKPLTRKERADNVRKRNIFGRYGDKARQVLDALLDKYANEGISQLENRKVLSLDPFRQMGSPASIAKLFGGNKKYLEAVKELEQEIYNAG